MLSTPVRPSHVALLAALTGEDGRYVLVIPPGRPRPERLVVTRIGYERLNQTLPPEGFRIRMDAELEEAFIAPIECTFGPPTPPPPPQ